MIHTNQYHRESVGKIDRREILPTRTRCTTTCVSTKGEVKMDNGRNYIFLIYWCNYFFLIKNVPNIREGWIIDVRRWWILLSLPCPIGLCQPSIRHRPLMLTVLANDEVMSCVDSLLFCWLPKYQTLRADRRAVNLFLYINHTTNRLVSSSWFYRDQLCFLLKISHIGLIITCCELKSGRITLDRSFSIGKKVNIRRC